MVRRAPDYSARHCDLVKEFKLRSGMIRFVFRKSTYATFDHISELEGDLKSQDTSLGDLHEVRG